MRAILVKTHQGKQVSKIIKEFTDAPALYEFLKSQGFYLEFQDAVDDLMRDEVTYSVPVLAPMESDRVH